MLAHNYLIFMGVQHSDHDPSGLGICSHILDLAVESYDIGLRQGRNPPPMPAS